jgi:hypothetical protein
LENRTLLAVITVTSTDDSVNDNGQVTLRAAIESIDAGADVNAAVTAHRVGPYLKGNPGPDEVAFDIPGSDVHTIDLSSALPSISEPIIIDGLSQPGTSPNANPAGVGLDSVLLIEINGANAGLLPDGVLDLAAGNSTVRGLVINRAQGPDIELKGSGNDLIAGNFLGTDASGTAVFPPNSSSGGTLDGVFLKSSANNTIGGTVAADRNLISGNGGNGIEIPLYLDTGNLIDGNLIGTDITGTKALGNGETGVATYGGNGSDSTVGGTAAGAGNVISGNRVGIRVAGPYVVERNLIGTDPSGKLNVGNAQTGVLVSANGSGAQIVGNTIAFNGTGAMGQGAGVQINSGTTNGNGNLVSQNMIFSNFGIGIELGALGQTGNQPVPTPGPNNSQNAPILGSVTAAAGGTEVQGSLASVVGDTFRLEFFANAARDQSTFSDILPVLPGEFAEGQTYVGSLVVTAVSASANFTANLPALPAGEPFVTAIATDITNTGTGPVNNTSEFSPLAVLGGPSLVVTNTGDQGLGTLREAIYSADNMSGPQTITFNIPPTDPRHFYYANDGMAGQVSANDIRTTTAANDTAITGIDPDWPHSWYSIEPASALPPLMDIDSINGYSQTGSSQNALAALEQGLNTVLTIEIDGQNVAGDGLTLQPPPSNTSGSPGSSTIQGLAINRFGGNGITFSSFSGDIIAGNFIGTDVSGSLALGNSGNGIDVQNVDNFTIGGSARGAANLISGNGQDGVYVFDDGIAGQIEGDLIGGGRSITAALPNAMAGVDIQTTAAAVAPAVQPADIAIPVRIVVEGGLLYLHFGLILLNSEATKDTDIGMGVIAGFMTPVPFRFRQSGSGAISPFGAPAPGPAIDLENGANPLTSQPVLTTAATVASTTVTGTLNSQPNSTYLIQFYSNTQLLPSGFGPGEQYVGSVTMTTNAAGNGSFTFQSPTLVPVGQFITATATYLDSSGNPLETSEFSRGIVVGNVVEQPRPQVVSVSTAKLIKRRVNEGTSTINIVFSEAMGALAGSSDFYSVETPKKVRVHKKLRTKLVPVRFTARLVGPNSVSLKLAKPSKVHLTLVIQGGDPAANGATLGQNVTITVQ